MFAAFWGTQAAVAIVAAGLYILIMLGCSQHI